MRWQREFVLNHIQYALKIEQTQFRKKNILTDIEVNGNFHLKTLLLSSAEAYVGDLADARAFKMMLDL